MNEILIEKSSVYIFSVLFFSEKLYQYLVEELESTISKELRDLRFNFKL